MYTVYSDEVFSAYGEGRYRVGEYVTYEEAVEVCKKRVRDYVAQFKSEKELYLDHAFDGEDPWVCPVPEGEHFSSYDYLDECVKEAFGNQPQNENSN